MGDFLSARRALGRAWDAGAVLTAGAGLDPRLLAAGCWLLEPGVSMGLASSHRIGSVRWRRRIGARRAQRGLGGLGWPSRVAGRGREPARPAVIYHRLLRRTSVPMSTPLPLAHHDPNFPPAPASRGIIRAAGPGRRVVGQRRQDGLP